MIEQYGAECKNVDSVNGQPILLFPSHTYMNKIHTDTAEALIVYTYSDVKSFRSLFYIRC